MDVAAFIVSVFALLVAAGALWYARVQAKAAVEQTKAESERLAMEKAEAQKYRIPWRLEWRAGDTYALVNDSDEPEYDVHVALPEHTFVDLRSDGKIIGPRSVLIFMAGFTLASPGRMVHVKWHHNPGGPVLEWNERLPRRE